jgi:hypothetical protein
MNYKDLKDGPVKTTPENVREANQALFRAKMTLPAAAKHCGMTNKEMKLTFWEYLKYNKPDYEITNTYNMRSVGKYMKDQHELKELVSINYEL